VNNFRSSWPWRVSIRAVLWVGARVISLLPTQLWLRIREKASIVRRMDYKRHPIYLQVDSHIENTVRLNSCKKEPGTISWIEDYFKRDDVFYDIGANVGAYSLVAFRFLDSHIKIFSFEPGFSTFPQLCKNIHLNEAGEAIVPLPVALFDQTLITSFHYQNLLPGGALHALGTPLDQNGNPFQPVFSLPVLGYRLDDFIKQFQLPLPNHIKIDVDGTEYQILKGAEQILGRQELRTVLLEIDREDEIFDKITNLLKEKGLFFHSKQDFNNLYCRGS
jgi:FkbM family methyltransferase